MYIIAQKLVNHNEEQVGIHYYKETYMFDNGHYVEAMDRYTNNIDEAKRFDSENVAEHTAKGLWFSWLCYVVEV